MKTWTQRKFLSLVSSFYDPLGIISPFLIQAKILLQKLSQHGQKWDKAISGDNGNASKDWVRETKMSATVGVNRLVGDTAVGEIIELHVFCDALLEESAVVAHIKTNRNQEATSGFLMGNNEWHPYAKQHFTD